MPEGFESMILKIFGTVPVRAHVAEITIKEREGFVVLKTVERRELKRFAATTVDAGFPNVDAVLPDVKKANVLTNVLNLKPAYLARAAKVFPDGMAIKFESELAPVAFTDCQYKDDEYSPTVVLMPIRAD